MSLVLFTQSMPPYNAGETAGFKPDRCAQLVAAGIAKHSKDPVRRAPTRVVDTGPKTVVRFKSSMPPYMTGEAAGFGKVRAAQLVKADVADYVEGDELKAIQARGQKPPPIKTQGKR